MPEMEFCEDIVKEEVITEFINGKKPERNTKEIQRKKRYFKKNKYKGEPQKEKDGYIVYTTVKLYEREDETDESGKMIIKRGYEGEINKKIIDRTEIRHLIDTKSETTIENNERYEYRNDKRTVENKLAKGFQYAGTAISAIGGDFIPRIPFIGCIFMCAGTVTGSISYAFASKTILIKQRRKIITTNTIRKTYKIFSDHSKEKTNSEIIDTKEMHFEWEDYIN